MELKPEQKKILAAVGKGDYGRSLIKLFDEIRNSMSNLDDIEGDYGAQVEGRKIFRKFCKGIIDAMKAQPEQDKQPLGSPDYD
jgi:hypothetical protein